jgi:histone H3/H4
LFLSARFLVSSFLIAIIATAEQHFFSSASVALTCFSSFFQQNIMALSESAITGAAARSHLKDAIGAFASHVGRCEGIELSQQSIAAIQASAINFARNLTSDVEMFARHRGARTVSSADLKMALRKSEPLVRSVQVTEAALAENLLNPQAPRAVAAGGNRKRGRPKKNSATDATSPIEFETAAVVGASELAQSVPDILDMLPQPSAIAPPTFKPPRSRIVRIRPHFHSVYDLGCACNSVPRRLTSKTPSEPHIQASTTQQFFSTVTEQTGAGAPAAPTQAPSSRSIHFLDFRGARVSLPAHTMDQPAGGWDRGRRSAFLAYASK